MFERFTTQTRQAVVSALTEARSLGASQIGCEHLLLGLACQRSGPAIDALSAAGLGFARLRELASGQPTAEPLNAEALALLGIDLDEVRRAAEAAFGPGALDRSCQRSAATPRARMTVECKKAIELGLRQAQRAQAGAVSPGHLLIGIIDQGDNGALRLLAAADVDPAALRADTLRRTTQAA